MAGGQAIGTPRPWSRDRFERVRRGARDPTPWLMPSPNQWDSRDPSSSATRRDTRGDTSGASSRDQDTAGSSDSDLFFNFETNSSLTMARYFDFLEKNGAPESAHWSP